MSIHDLFSGSRWWYTMSIKWISVINIFFFFSPGHRISSWKGNFLGHISRGFINCTGFINWRGFSGNNLSFLLFSSVQFQLKYSGQSFVSASLTQFMRLWTQFMDNLVYLHFQPDLFIVRMIFFLFLNAIVVANTNPCRWLQLERWHRLLTSWLHFHTEQINKRLYSGLWTWTIKNEEQKRGAKFNCEKSKFESRN